ncbi:signal peptidase II [Acetitomaculum ruminis DSM 5522]|uniref:Lipoprotein signal peptidase n=1 Tax=Acetitomaculum ruminis DSM 5522 TaxID=1120918 RepID=A0A1I0V5X2_9FIRM|nr:signal peptidase II [Acetitomaculum ruminis]SFA71721.1 signal peptidase II [Acetitomaculum ruminis DSM 5522]
MYKNKKNKYIYGFLLLIFLLAIDFFTKYLADKFLKGKEPIIIFKDALELYYLENTGAAFGIMAGKQMFFVIVSILILIGIIYIYVKIPLEQRFNILNYLCIFVMAGAIGNLVNRIMLNYVIDFIYFSLIRFPVFNVADIYVTLAITILIIVLLLVFDENDLSFLKPKKKED